MNATSQISKTFLRKALVVIALVAVTAILIVLTWLTKEILVLLFAGILLGVLLTGTSGWIRQHTPLSHRQAFGVVLLLFVVGTGIVGVLAIPSLLEQAQQLGNNLEESINTLERTLSNGGWAQPIIDRLPALQTMLTNIPGGMSGVFSQTFGMFFNVIVIILTGLFLAFEPDVYANGLLKLTPPSYRHRAGEVLDELAHKLRWWLLGRLASMAIVGVLSVIGLWILGIPLAFFLGVLAGLLAFIPFIGPALAVIPPALIAFTISPTQALYVLLLYAGIQLVESNLITPIIQRRAVDLPPVVLLITQSLFGLFFSFVGLAVAAPFAAVMITLTKMLYMEDVLGEDADLLKEDPDARFAANEAEPA